MAACCGEGVEENSFLLLLPLENPASPDQCSSPDPRQPAASARAGAWTRTGAWARAKRPAEPAEYPFVPATAHSKSLHNAGALWRRDGHCQFQLSQLGLACLGGGASLRSGFSPGQGGMHVNGAPPLMQPPLQGGVPAPGQMAAPVQGPGPGPMAPGGECVGFG